MLRNILALFRTLIFWNVKEPLDKILKTMEFPSFFVIITL